MIDITFRGKRKDDGNWVEGAYFNNENGDHIIESPILNERLIVDSNTVSKFTGILDKYNSKVFEGDIFGIPDDKFPNRFCRVVRYINDVPYLVDDTPQGSYGNKLEMELELNSNYVGIARYLKDNGYDYKKIGNIWDNPELISKNTK